MTMDSVAGGGVPVGAWNNRTATAAGTSYDGAGGQPVFAAWAFDVPVMVPHTACQADTKKGGKCPMGRVGDTSLCVSHWNVLAKAFGEGMVNTVGA